jgi:hypothetical protein
LTREQTRRSPEEDKLRNQSIQDVWDLHEASEVHLVYLLVDTESISFEKKQLEIKDGRLWIIEVEKNDTQGWRNQHELMSWKRRLDSLLVDEVRSSRSSDEMSNSEKIRSKTPKKIRMYGTYLKQAKYTWNARLAYTKSISFEEAA